MLDFFNLNFYELCSGIIIHNPYLQKTTLKSNKKRVDLCSKKS